jgi:selenocysteine-specific elongation factor
MAFMTHATDGAIAGSITGAAQTPRYAILGTAGHIDHGKSTLVKALTGTDPDRLPEEQARGMTIELGFAPLDLPGARLGIVDVPGHERFVRTMVAGATGINIGLLVVAADDGVMPQTREHVDILDLLGIRHGLVAISKIDVVDAARVSTVSEQVSEELRGTTLERWPHVAVSALRGDGLEELKQRLGEIAAILPVGQRSEVFRMAVDRVFAVRGRGTVVTGSVLRGRIEAGGALEWLPSARPCRVREVQSHGSTQQGVHFGQRAALNLTGVERETIERGHELATPGALIPSRYLDIRVRLVARMERPWRSHRRVRVSLGTREAMAMMVLLDADELAPGQNGPAQLRFNEPIVAGYGQRLIIRDETAQRTLGGGTVLRPNSYRFRQRFDPSQIAMLRALESDDPLVRLGVVLRDRETRSPVRLACLAGVEPGEIPTLLERLRAEGVLTRLGEGEVHRDALTEWSTRALAYLGRHHQRHPAEPGVLTDRFIGRLEKWCSQQRGRDLLARLEQEKVIERRGPYVALAAFRPALSPDDARLLEGLVAEISAAGLDPPDWPKLKVVAGLSRQRSNYLSELARSEPRLVQVAPNLYVSTEAVETLKRAVRELGRAGRRFRLAEVRDALSLSRRAVLPLLEYLDRTRLTRRVGDERVVEEAGS